MTEGHKFDPDIERYPERAPFGQIKKKIWRRTCAKTTYNKTFD